jgi:predicted GNAT family acetyltransferase
MSSPRISFEQDGSKGRLVLRIDGSDLQGELTFVYRSDSLVVVNHTGVPNAWRGRGYATLLAERMVEEARERGLKIIPQCSFMQLQADRNPAWADVIQL